MPILHRLACFRDDVVFLIFLYQAGYVLSVLFPWLTVAGPSAGSIGLTQNERTNTDK